MKMAQLAPLDSSFGMLVGSFLMVVGVVDIAVECGEDPETGVETEALAEVEAEGEAGVLAGWAGPIT